jgi:acyl-coenzyme A synthetase/AMP-(fatty) acid ligase
MQPGCLWIGAASLYCSYYPEPPGIQQRWNTNDMVTQTPEGHMHFAGRCDNLLVSGGLKIDLGYVHDCLAQTGLLGAFGLLLRPHPVWGQAVHVYHTGCVDQAAIRAALEPVLPAFAIPKVWVQTQQLPVNDNGKLQPGLLG